KKNIPIINLEEQEEKNYMEDFDIHDFINEPTSQKPLIQENQQHNEEDQLGQKKNLPTQITSYQVTELRTHTHVISSQSQDIELPSQSVHMQQAHEHLFKKKLLSHSESSIQEQLPSQSSISQQLLSQHAVPSHHSHHYAFRQNPSLALVPSKSVQTQETNAHSSVLQQFSQTVQIHQKHSKSSSQEQIHSESFVPQQILSQMTGLSQLHSQSATQQQDQSLETLIEKNFPQVQETYTNHTVSQHKGQVLPQKQITMYPQQYLSHSQKQQNPSLSTVFRQPPTQSAMTQLSPNSAQILLPTQSAIQQQSSSYPTSQIHTHFQPTITQTQPSLQQTTNHLRPILHQQRTHIHPHFQPPTAQTQPPLHQTTNQVQPILQQQRTQIRPHFQPSTAQKQPPLQQPTNQQRPILQHHRTQKQPQFQLPITQTQPSYIQLAQFVSPTFPQQTHTHQHAISSQENITNQYHSQRQQNHHSSLIQHGTRQPAGRSKELPPHHSSTQYPSSQTSAVLPPQWQSSTLLQPGPQLSPPQQPSSQPSTFSPQHTSHQQPVSLQPNITIHYPSKKQLNPQPSSIQQGTIQHPITSDLLPPQLSPPLHPTSQPSTFPSQPSLHQHPLISQPNITIHYPPQRHKNPIPSSKQVGTTQSTVLSLAPPQHSPQTQKHQEQETQNPHVQYKSNTQQKQIQQHPQMLQPQQQAHSQIINNLNQPRHDLPQHHQHRIDQYHAPRHSAPTYQQHKKSITKNHLSHHQYQQQNLKQLQNLQELQIQRQHQRITSKEPRTSASCQQQKQIWSNADEMQHQKQKHNTSNRAKTDLVNQEKQQAHRKLQNALSDTQADQSRLELAPCTSVASGTPNAPAQTRAELIEVITYSKNSSQYSDEELLEPPDPPSTPLYPLPQWHYPQPLTPAPSTPAPSTPTPFSLGSPTPFLPTSTQHSPAPPNPAPPTPTPPKPAPYTSTPNTPATSIHAPLSPTSIDIPDTPPLTPRPPSTPAPKITVAELAAPLQDTESETFNVVHDLEERKDEIEISKSQWIDQSATMQSEEMGWNIRIEETFHVEETSELNPS
ncbi:unnamed protein product, partial [Meganyctiphanes norvegica]